MTNNKRYNKRNEESELIVSIYSIGIMEEFFRNVKHMIIILFSLYSVRKMIKNVFMLNTTIIFFFYSVQYYSVTFFLDNLKKTYFYL